MQQEKNEFHKELTSFTLEVIRTVDKKDPASVAAVAELLKVYINTFDMLLY